MNLFKATAWLNIDTIAPAQKPPDTSNQTIETIRAVAAEIKRIAARKPSHAPAAIDNVGLYHQVLYDPEREIARLPLISRGSLPGLLGGPGPIVR